MGEDEPSSRLGVIAPLVAAATAMASFQVGAALAKQLFPALGPLAVATLRISLGAVLLLAIMRPWRTWPKRASIWPLLGLGLAMPGVILMFYMAMARLPLGVAIALQFLGPLSVAIAGSRRWRDLVWAGLAAGGVWLLVGVGGAEGGRFDAVGVGWALGAAVGWASYILCGRAAGVAFGRSAAALAVSLAAVVILPFGAPAAARILHRPDLIPAALAVAVLSTAVPFSLELFAMPRLPSRTFAIFTSLEPAFAVLFGFAMLHERLTPAQMTGVAAVISAAAGAAWTSNARRAAPTDFAEAPPT